MTTNAQKNEATEIGREIARMGCDDVMPTCKRFAVWQDIRRTLGHDVAVQIARDAFNQEK